MILKNFIGLVLVVCQLQVILICQAEKTSTKWSPSSSIRIKRTPLEIHDQDRFDGQQVDEEQSKGRASPDQHNNPFGVQTDRRASMKQSQNRPNCPRVESNGRKARYSRNRRQLNRFRVNHPNPNRHRNKNQEDKKNGSNCDDNRQTGVQDTDQDDALKKEKVIETAVFIDQALDNRFNGVSNGLVELNKLILTIMSQVQLLFKYSTMEVPITLKLVLVEHIKESERQFEGLQAPNPERGNIDLYLGNFCNWQQARLEREKRLWWDHAILLSGLDLHKATPQRNHSGVLGLAWVGGMCKGNYSCTINEAPNFESSFVIAHELGHSLGIVHDGQKDRCDRNGFIMSDRTGAGKIHWSKCSNNYIKESISRGELKCLDEERNGQIDPMYDLSKLREPGQVYSINEQCKLAFGNDYSSVVTHEQPFNAVCRELWCQSGTSAHAAHPALEGSHCGDRDRVCRQGKCV